EQRPFGPNPGVAGRPIRRSTPHRLANGDELCRLVSLFDCSSVAIGFVTFFAEPPHDRGQALVMARFEADDLGIHRDTGGPEAQAPLRDETVPAPRAPAFVSAATRDIMPILARSARQLPPSRPADRWQAG